MRIIQVSQCKFERAYEWGWDNSENIRNNCTPISEIDWTDKVLYLTSDCRAGYAVNKYTNELTNVFSTVKGRGGLLVTSAIAQGANNLDCFDGYLVKFYTSLGFKSLRTEANWTKGQPAVVYMAL